MEKYQGSSSRPMINLQEFLTSWNKKHTSGAVEDLIKKLSQLESPLTDPDEYEITKKEFCTTWKWEKWIPSLNKPNKTIRIVLEIELLVSEKGVLWSASDYDSYRDFVIPQTRAFKFLSRLHPNIDQETLIQARQKIIEDLPWLTKSMWMRDNGDRESEDEGGMFL